MPFETFNPPVRQSPGTKVAPEVKLLTAEFGDGYKPLYWFGVGVDRKGRLHLHGGIAAHTHELPAIRAAQLRIGGKWEAKRGAEHQLHMNPQWCDDRWAQYAYRNMRSAQKVLKGRAFTITGPLRAEAKEIYVDCRAVMAAV